MLITERQILEAVRGLKAADYCVEWSQIAGVMDGIVTHNIVLKNRDTGLTYAINAYTDAKTGEWSASEMEGMAVVGKNIASKQWVPVFVAEDMKSPLDVKWQEGFEAGYKKAYEEMNDKNMNTIGE